MVRVVFPLIRPGLIVVGILTFMMAWNQFFFALVLAGDRVRMLPLLGSNYISTFTVEWGRVAAYGVLLLVPPLAVVLSLQGRIVRGLTFGAVKG
jgi:multiple sugar transport system permease protein